MTRAEIDRQFDEIVDFSEIEQFLDTPVKRYSSGMYVRLAFAVAAHLEPEILIVDEVLAVGDAAFQKKCLGKMEDVAGAGRTVLFVSHNMPAVRSLCTRVVQLRRRAASSTPARRPRSWTGTCRLQGGRRRRASTWEGDDRPGDDEARLGRPCASRDDVQPTPIVISSRPSSCRWTSTSSASRTGSPSASTSTLAGRHRRVPQLPDRRVPRRVAGPQPGPQPP